VPGAYSLGEAGKSWWKWAWTTPQATGWDASALYTAARRASLEDDLAALELTAFDDLEDALLELVGADGDDRRVRSAITDLEFGVRRLKGLAGGRVGVMKEMRELDGKLGLNPKALAELRWTILAEEDTSAAPAPAPPTPPTPPSGSKRQPAEPKVRQLRAV
jgi:hypothetical protein